MKERWITEEDFKKAKAALEKADVEFRNVYCYGPNGDFYMNEGKPIPRIALGAPTEARGEFKSSGGTRTPESLQNECKVG